LKGLKNFVVIYIVPFFKALSRAITRCGSQKQIYASRLVFRLRETDRSL